MSEQTVNILQELGCFDSIYEAKVLAYMFYNPINVSGAKISNDLKISDSKIYPALKNLLDLGLVSKDESERPHKYFLVPPEGVLEYLSNHVQNEYRGKQKLVDECTKLIYEGWNNSHLLNRKINQIFHDEAIITQIMSFLNLKVDHVRIILGSKSKKYLENINKIILEFLSQKVKIDLAIPHSQVFVSHFSEILNSKNFKDLMNLKQSNFKNESYFIFDRRLLFTLNQSTIADLAFFNKEKDLISRTNIIWNNDDLCGHFHRLLRRE